MLKKVGILANGGDVSGFNAVIRAIVKTAENHGVECYGIIDGYNGLLNKRFELLMQQLAGRENITEELKANNQMEWVAKMNNIKNRVEEIIFNELIYV